MGLNQAELDFAKRHYPMDEVIRLSNVTEVFDAFDAKYIYPYENDIFLGHLIRENALMAKEFQDAVDSLKPYEDNLIVKCHLARLYSLEYKYDSFQRALEYVQEGAEAGLAEAQWIYGRFLLSRNGEKARNEAMSWFKRAADQGHPDAKCEMGIRYNDMYYDAEDINSAKNYLSTARHLFEEAANCRSAYHLSAMRCINDKDPLAAEKILKMIVDRYPMANLGLGLLYSDTSKYNTTIDINYSMAYEYLKKSAVYGYLPAYERLVLLYHKHKISGAETEEYWVRMAIAQRERRKRMLFERDRFYHKPRTVSSEMREIYNNYGYYDLPAVESETSQKSGGSNKPTRSGSGNAKNGSCLEVLAALALLALIILKMCS